MTKIDDAFMENSGRDGWYHPDDKPLSLLLGEKCKIVNESFDKYQGDMYTLLEYIMNNTYKLASWHMRLIGTGIVPASKETAIMFATLHKNFFAIHSAMKLTRDGLFGSARTLLRHVFEYLVVAKFCALSKDDSVFEKWDSGDTIYFTNGILKKINKPNTDELNKFWCLMCDYSHATKLSQQIDINFNDEHYKEIRETICFVRILLECHYHLLNSIILTDSVKYYAKQYCCKSNETKIIRDDNRRLLKETRGILGANSKALIKCYTAKWEIK